MARSVEMLLAGAVGAGPEELAALGLGARSGPWRDGKLRSMREGTGADARPPARTDQDRAETAA